MIEAILSELEALKAKVDAAIQHVKSGVTTLNEDQQDELKKMVTGIEDEAFRVTGKVHELVGGVETKADGLVAKVESIFEDAKDKVEGFFGIVTKPSADDLDAVAADQAAAEATAPIPPAIATDEPTPEPPAAA